MTEIKKEEEKSLNFLEEIVEEDLAAGSQEQGFARRILAACERGKRLVDQVLDFAMAKTARTAYSFKSLVCPLLSAKDSA